MNFALFVMPLLVQTFEVTSVKPCREASIGNQYRVSPNGDLRIVNMSLRELVRTAYGLHESQLSGGPAWFDIEHWNIEAKVGDVRPDASRKTTSIRLKALLDQRFQLVTHRELHPLAVLVLVQVKSGHKLVPAKPGEEAKARGAGRGEISTKSYSMQALSSLLGGMMGRIVLSETDLAGQYAFDLTWAPDAMTERLPGQPADMARTEPVFGPSIYAALQQQLGLRLVAKTMPVEVVIVDRASRPSAN